MKLTIAVLTYKNQAAFERCCSAIAQQTVPDHISWEVLLVFNGASYSDVTDPWYGYPNEHYRTIHLKDNVGNVAGQNACFKYAEGEWVLFVSDDVVLKKHAIENLIHTMESLEDTPRRVGQIMPTIYQLNGEIDTCGLNIRWPGYGVSIKEAGWLWVPAVPSICYLMRKSVWEEIGGFDEKFPMAYEDVDMGIRLGRAGYHSAVSAIASVVHEGNATLRYTKKDRWRFRQGRERLIDKHFLRWNRVTRKGAVRVLDTIRGVLG